MKKIVLLLGLLLVVLTATAGEVTVEEARQKAREFLMSRHGTAVDASQHRMPRALTLQLVDEVPSPLLHVFNCGDNEGFIIMSGDDRTASVLGYADTGSFQQDMLPDNMLSWLQDYAEQMTQLDVCGLSQTFGAVLPPHAQRNAVAPLLSSRWGQNAPYNAQCPIDPTTGDACKAGCVAVSMAQIMYYYKYPDKTVATIPAYISNKNSISMPAIRPVSIDWANILPSYGGENVTQQQSDAVAQLMLLCGSSVKMDYGSGSSAASSSAIAVSLPTYFGYDSDIHTVSRKDYTMEQWEDIIYGELANGRPVVYSGQRDTEESDSRHSFVVDGCDGQGFYHVNWGWTGNYNGYFLLSVLSPYVTSEQEQLLSNEGYSMSQQAVVGIMPDDGSQPAPLLMTSNSLTFSSASTATRTSTSSNFPAVNFTLGTYNYTGQTAYFDVGVGLVDKQDNIVATKTIVTNQKLDPNYGWRALTGTIAFGSGLANGDYRLVGISRESGKGLAWQVNNSSINYFIQARIEGNKLSLRQATISLSGQLTLSGDAETKKMAVLTMQLHNDGTDFNDVVYLFIDGKRSGGRYVDLAADAEATVQLGFTPASEGSHTVSIRYSKDNEYVNIASLVVNVKPAAVNNLELRLLTSNAEGRTVGSTLRLSVEAHNVNTATYDNKVRANMYKLRHDGTNIGDFAARVEHHLLIPPDGTAETEFLFEGLEDGETYFVWIYYISQGEPQNDGRLYGGRYEVVIQDRVDLADIAADDGTVSVFSLDGRLVKRCRRSELTGQQNVLPRSIYIVEGKKQLLR